LLDQKAVTVEGGRISGRPEEGLGAWCARRQGR
jgi:hypothetical protein